MKVELKKRDSTIDCMKGFAIILMVMGHSGFVFTPFIYLFHMALFFMISGYLWNDKNVSTFANMKKYIWRKVKTLWIPFVLWNQLILLCNNLFLNVHFYTDAVDVSAFGESIPIHTYMGIRDMIKPFLKIFFFRTDLELGGATWFLAALFIISILHMAVRWISTHWKYGKWVFAAVCIGIAVFCQLLCMNVPIPINLMIKRALFAYFAFLLGYFFQKIPKREESFYMQAVLFFGAAVLLIVGYTEGWENSIGGAKSDNLLVYILMSVSGWYFCKIPAVWCGQKLKKFFSYIGKHTLCIVLCHFLSFKLVSYLYILITEGPTQLIGSFPTIAGEVPSWLWAAYTAAGVAVSLLIGLCARFFWGHLSGFLHLNKKR